MDRWILVWDLGTFSPVKKTHLSEKGLKMCPLRKGREELVACATYPPSSDQSGKRNWVNKYWYILLLWRGS